MPRNHNVPRRVAPSAARAVAVALAGGAATLVTVLSPGIAAAAPAVHASHPAHAPHPAHASHPVHAPHPAHALHPAHASRASHASRAVQTATAEQASTARLASLPRSSDVVGGRFVAPAALDTATFKVVPAPSHDQPTLSERRAAQEIWSSTALVGSTREGPVGFGLVTISMRAKGVPRITKLAAWVGFAKSSDAANCPAEVIPSVGTASPTSGPSPQQAPSDGYAAVVIGAHGSPAVTYTARSIVCDALRPATLARASEEYSVPWREVGGLADDEINVRATIPPCGVLQGSSSGGSAQEITIAIQAVVPDVHGRCTGSHVANQIVSLGPDANTPGAPPPLVTKSTKIRHGRLGPTATAGATPTATAGATPTAAPGATPEATEATVVTATPASAPTS